MFFVDFCAVLVSTPVVAYHVQAMARFAAEHQLDDGQVATQVSPAVLFKPYTNHAVPSKPCSGTASLSPAIRCHKHNMET